MKIWETKVDKYFVLDKILYGQCFRWNKNNEGKFIGVVNSNVIKIWQEKNIVKYYGMNNKQLDKWFYEYFDMQIDYGKVIKSIQKKVKNVLLDDIISYSVGTRILKQDMFEIVVSYIFSANNNIPSIMSSIEKLCKEYGNELEFEGNKYYSFPTVNQLKKVTKNEYREKIRIGFRDSYVEDTVKKIANGQVDLESISSMSSQDAKKELLKLKGVGPKVANCILLFSMQKKDVFPVDVWIDKVMQVYSNNKKISKKEIEQIVENDFESFSGIINHYMFYWGRENKI